MLHMHNALAPDGAECQETAKADGGSALRSTRPQTGRVGVNVKVEVRPGTWEGFAMTGQHSAASRATLRMRLHFSLIASDIAAIYGSFLLAQLLYPAAEPDTQWAALASILTPFYLALSLSARSYSSDIIVRPMRGVSRAVQSLILAGGVLLFALWMLQASATFSRVVVGLGFGFSLVTLASARTMFVARAQRLLGGNPYQVILINQSGNAPPGSDYAMVLPLSIFDPSDQSPAAYDQLAQTLGPADRVVVDCPPELRAAWAHVLQGADIQAEFRAPELMTLRPLDVSSDGGQPTLVVAKGPLSLPDRVKKRLFDLSITLFALVMLAPLMMFVAIAVKASSPGPVFFKQTRIGRANRLFKVLKFRSMRVESADQAGNISASRDDDRITPIGRFIRATSIDELPQLINVLWGEMSIVGPRPHALGSRAGDQLFWEVDNRYWHRHATKPGLTGLAQVRGFRGATLRRVDLTDRLGSDLEYLNDWTLWRDIWIVIRTFGVIVHKNAF